jgi:hypothetical protein
LNRDGIIRREPVQHASEVPPPQGNEAARPVQGGFDNG